MRAILRIAPAIVALVIAATTEAQTSDAGIPVVGTHPTDEVLPTLIRDGQGGAWVGFQGGGVHVARLHGDATPDLTWTPGTLTGLLGGLPGSPTIIALGGDSGVWAAGYGQLPGGFYMSRDDAGGVPDPAVVARRPSSFSAGMVKAVSQADGSLLMLNTPLYANGTPELRVDRVEPDGSDLSSTVGLPIFTQSGAIHIDAVHDATSTTTIVSLLGGFYSGVHALKLLADGSPAWPSVTRQVSTMSTSGAQVVRLATDGAGGVFLAWTSATSDLYVSHLLADGTVAPGWGNGKAVGVTTGNQSDQRILGDGHGGAWLLWTDTRTGPVNVYYSHLGGDGALAPGFPAIGRALSSAPNARNKPQAAPDGAGGFFAVWSDARSGTSLDVYGQHVLADGSFAPGLAADGEPICTNATDQLEMAIVDVAYNAATVAWRDSRSGTPVVYAAPMPVGNTGLDAPGRGTGRLALAPAGANPTHGPLEWRVTAPGPSSITVRLVDVTGRTIETRIVQAGGESRVRFSPPGPGLYFVTATAAGASITCRAVSLR